MKTVLALLIAGAVVSGVAAYAAAARPVAKLETEGRRP